MNYPQNYTERQIKSFIVYTFSAALRGKERVILKGKTENMPIDVNESGSVC